MLHQYRVKLNSGATAVVDGRMAVPVSIFMAAGTVTIAGGIDKTGPWSTAVAQTAPVGQVTSIDPTKCPVSPWYQVVTTGGAGTLVMQERL
jgi:Flp pilus assembly pilin Flp